MRHYGRFYGTPDGDADLPLVAVTGNCQAGSIRRLLESTGRADAVLIPPVHELTADDVPHLRALLARADVLVAQPVRDGYRGLPIGWREQAALLPADATVVRYPVLRWAGLHPWQAIIRPPSDTSATPPLVPYHDLRILLQAAGVPGLSRDDAPATPSPAGLRAVAAASVEALRSRERAHDTVPAADLLEAAPTWHTINHPDNATLIEVARRIADAAGIGGEVRDPGWEMLGGTRARIDEAAADALGVAPAAPGPEWIVGEEPVDDEQLRDAHLTWYREHPDAVAEGLRRHSMTIETLTGATP